MPTTQSPYPPIFTTQLGTRQLVTFFDPNNPTNTFQTNLNPNTLSRTPMNVRKYTATTNGQATILGQAEYPPSELLLTWPQLDYGQVQQLIQFQAINPLVFIDNNDQGYYGVLVIDSLEQLVGMRGNVWAIKVMFLVTAPYNGLVSTINTLTPPGLVATPSTTKTGYINTSTSPIYIWPTIYSPWGESLASDSQMLTINPANFVSHGGPSGMSGTQAWDITYSPTNGTTSVFFRKVRLYWNTTGAGTSASATMLTDIFSGFTNDGSHSWTIWTPVINYNSTNPPTLNLAFAGQFNGSLWTNGAVS